MFKHCCEIWYLQKIFRVKIYSLTFKNSRWKGKWLLAVSSGINTLYTAPLMMWTILDGLTGAVVPLLCGVAMLVITWYTAFLDRCIPGVYPTPAEPVKKRLFSWPAPFHLGHTIALVNGLVISFLIFFEYQNSDGPISS